MIKNGGKGRDQSWVMGGEIETMAPMRSVLGGSVFDGDVILVGCDRSGVMRSSVDRSGWIGLRW